MKVKKIRQIDCVTTISLDKRLANRARVEAARQNISRSAFIRRLLEQELERLEKENSQSERITL